MKSLMMTPLVVLLLLVSSAFTFADDNDLSPRIKEVLDSHSFAQLLQSPAANLPLEDQEVNTVGIHLWKKFQAEQRNNPQRLLEHQNKVMTFNNHSMRYSLSKMGEQPAEGYPLYIALHGGGGAPTWLNDSQWEHMKVYYKDSVKNGIYIATRGVTDTWDLHFRPESYVLYERLIENMILYEGVDPNKVYLLGFSAGGDGVYQVTPRLADRWAAANMSAGHPNGTSMTNLMNVPFLIQVGEYDSAYNRNRVGAEYHVLLENLRKRFGNGYQHETFIHLGQGHNFADNDAAQSLQDILADPQGWLNEGNRTSVKRNTNGIAWVSQFSRNPLPNRVVWDLKTRASREATSLWMVPTHGQQHYWLDIGNQTHESLGTDEIIVRLDPAQNGIIVEKAKTYLKILLNQRLLDLTRPIHVEVGGQSFDVEAKSNLKNLVRTLADRGDHHFLFPAEIVLKEVGGSWTIE